MSMMESFGTALRVTAGRTPIHRLMLSGVPLDVNVQSATINLGEDLHDTVEMTVSSSELVNTAGILEQPISFLYGNTTKTEVFCGYVTSVNEQQNDTGVLTWTMGITGPTKPMQTGNPRFWSNRTIPSAVEHLSYFSYLGYVGHDHTHRWLTLAQAEGSDWKTVVSLARRLGWSIYNRYGVVMLRDPLQLFLEEGSAARLLSETYTLAKGTLDEERSLLEFEPVEEAESSVNQRGYKVAYFSGGSVQVALQQGQHSSYKFISNFVIRNAEEAAFYVNSLQHDSSNWRQTAQARIMGNANLFPSMSVDILTTNPKYHTGKFNGRWYVRGVQHKLDKQTFQTNLALARPDGKQQVYTGAYSPFWQSQTRPRPTLSLAPSMGTLEPLRITRQDFEIDDPTILPAASAGVWISSWTNSNIRSVA